MTTPSRTRIVRDYKRLVYDPPEGINASPNPSNIMHWNAVIFGPEDTPWDGGHFKLTMKFSEDYPTSAPVVKFVSNMFHPNIYPDGSICLDILQEKWNPLYDVCSILTSIQSLLTDPNPNSPANPEAAKLFSENKKVYLEHVNDCVERSWMDEGSNEALIQCSEEKDPLISDPPQGGQQEEETEVKKSEIEENSSSDSETDETLEHCVSREDDNGKVFKRQKREEV